MKYIDFKRYKFSKIYKYLDFSRYHFSKIYKYLYFLKSKSFVTLNDFNFKRYISFKIYKYIDFGRYNFSKIYKYLYYKKYKYILVYLVSFFVFLILVYLSLPMFFYYDKSNIENIVCKELNVKCSIQSKITYSFLPSPRIKFENLTIKDSFNKKYVFAKVKNAEIKLSIYKLYNKQKFNYIETKFKDSEINFDLKNFNKYKKFFSKGFGLRSINFKGGNINFIEGKKHIATIKNINLKYRSNSDTTEVILKGVSLEDKIHFSFKSNKKEKKPSKTFMLKLLDFGLLTKLDIIDNELSSKDVISGNFFIKHDKNKLTAIFDYKDDKIIIKHSNLRNSFLDGNSDGEIVLFPYFDFNLNLNLNSVNFNKLFSSLISLNEEDKKKLFKINKKMNGILNLYVNKIFSRHTLIHSLESEIKFSNGNIFLERALLNLGKIGAADLTGIIRNDKKFTRFKFENNIFIDNLKRFYNKFGIYNKPKIPYNLFVSGNFDLDNLVLRIGEITSGSKFNDDDVAYIEKEFNDLLLETGYESLFSFDKLKEFIKSVDAE